MSSTAVSPFSICMPPGKSSAKPISTKPKKDTSHFCSMPDDVNGLLPPRFFRAAGPQYAPAFGLWCKRTIRPRVRAYGCRHTPRTASCYFIAPHPKHHSEVIESRYERNDSEYGCECSSPYLRRHGRRREAREACPGMDIRPAIAIANEACGGCRGVHNRTPPAA